MNQNDKQPLDASVFIVLLVVTFFVPIVGIIIGAINIQSPNRNGQACALVGLGSIMILVNLGFLANIL